jgi:hypothetical protein
MVAITGTEQLSLKVLFGSSMLGIFPLSYTSNSLIVERLEETSCLLFKH